MHKIKVGDKVRCISIEYDESEFTYWITNTSCRVGSVYEVIEISDSGNIKVSNSNYYLDKSHFEAV